MAKHTLRGQFQEGTVHRLIIDDGILTQGHKIVAFHVGPQDPTSAGADVAAVLSLQYDSPSSWEWQDNRQIAWASTSINSSSSLVTPYMLVDPNHIVIRDLYIQGTVGAAGGSSQINYLVELEPVTVTENEAVLQLIKERSQDDLR